ncbi:hypothetical protein [Synechococcus sp. ROS8604]|uniref:hypothetical protein n=1 Tax=Synechococcus sp. ROS8604 TaxID=1442557 RepID=UPI001647895E|nr:hypothetical protein [Synechococcus sp. ROS8604]QNI90239.1 hypothetical protein SynROS8604_03639 [Synechococcus sp. ROS8604]
MIEDFLNLLNDEQDLNSRIRQINYQIESLENENEIRLRKYERLKSKINRLKAINNLLLYVEDPSSDEFSSNCYSDYNDFLEKMIKVNHRKSV